MTVAPLVDFFTTQLKDDLVVIVSKMNDEKYVHDEDVHVACRCPNKIPRKGGGDCPTSVSFFTLGLLYVYLF